MTTLLKRDSLVDSPGSRRTAGNLETPGNQPAELLPGVSGFVTDTWVFFAAPPDDWTVSDRWGLGFGPVDIHGPRWSLFHCVDEDRFDSRSICPALNPSNRDLLRWSTSIVGPDTATLLIESVGSCREFYGQYFAERPDLRGPKRRITSTRQ